MKPVAIVLRAAAMASVATAALGGPYRTEHLRPSRAASTQTCESALDNNSYDCHVKSSFDSDFMDCFTFISPGSTSGHFDLVVQALSPFPLGCSCNPTGSIKKPKFNASKKAFDCAGDVQGESFDFAGKVGGSGKVAGHVSASNGDSFVYTCVPRVVPCGSPGGAFID